MAKLARFQRTITDDAGNVVENVTVEVRLELTGVLAALFSDRTGVTGIANPLLTGTDGFAAFYVIGGAYRVRAYTGPSEAPTFEKIWRHVGIGTASEYDASDAMFAVGLFFNGSGKFLANEALMPVDLPLPVTLETDTTGWYARVRTAPAVAKTVSIVKNGVQFATVAFAIGVTEGVFTMAAEIEFVAGDQVWPIMPAVADTTMADFSMVLLAKR
jgi:hypothetical protein